MPSSYADEVVEDDVVVGVGVDTMGMLTLLDGGGGGVVVVVLLGGAGWTTVSVTKTVVVSVSEPMTVVRMGTRGVTVSVAVSVMVAAGAPATVSVCVTLTVTGLWASPTVTVWVTGFGVSTTVSVTVTGSGALTTVWVTVTVLSLWSSSPSSSPSSLPPSSPPEPGSRGTTEYLGGLSGWAAGERSSRLGRATAAAKAERGKARRRVELRIVEKICILS